MGLTPPWERPAEPNPMLDSALAYARLGISVFPVHGLRNGVCSCGSTDCKSPAKHPATPHGLHDATTDTAQIRAWWGAKPYLNVASPTVDRITLDIDPRNGGDLSLERIEERYGKLPDTWMVYTGGGGTHYTYRLPRGLAIKTAHPISPTFPGIDLQGSGAYVLLPPSTHISGRKYLPEASSDILDGQAIATAPDWLLQLCALHSEAERSTEPVELHNAFPSELAEARAALDRLDPDCGYEPWVKVGQALHSTCWIEAYGLWAEWSAKGTKWCGDIELRKKWRSFDANRSVQVTINTLYWMAKQMGQQAEPPPASEAPKSSWLVFASDLMAERQTVAWTISGVIPHNVLGQIFGASGSGKTFVHLDMALHVATGRDWHGHKVKPGAVLLVAGEGFYGLSKRLHAWAGHHEQDMAGVPLVLTRGAIVVPDRKELGKLRDEVLAVQDRLAVPLSWIVLDTLNRNFGGGDENSTQDMSRFVDGMAWLRDELQTGVCPIHHTGHLDGSRSRGNSSLYGALDYEIKVERDRESRIIKLACTKMKDAEEFADKYFESVPVGTPVTDEEGAIQTSIVLVETAQPGEVDDVAPHHLQAASDIVRRLASEYIARLTSQDLAVPDPTLVPLEDVREAFISTYEKRDSGRRAWNRIKVDLVAQFGGSSPLKVASGQGGT